MEPVDRKEAYFTKSWKRQLCVRRLGGDTEYPLAGLPIALVHGDRSRLTSEDVGEKQFYDSFSRDGI